VTANAIAAVNEISKGRAILGLGAGDSALYGIGLHPQKVAEVEEAIDFFRRAAAIPIYLAVSQQRMCELAGRKADGAIVMGPAQPDIVHRQVEWIRAKAPRPDFEIAFIAPTSTDIDDVRSWASTQARLLSHHKQLPPSLSRFAPEITRSAESYDYAEHLSTTAGHSAAVSDELVRALAVVGSPDECAARLRDIRSAGVDTFIFPLAGRNRLERWRSLRRQIFDQIMV
jgi:5,10-methylenetetrahydromethanopterin reductase